MKINQFIFIAISLFLNISCDAQSNDSIAKLKINSNSSIQIRRVHIHAFLPEYDRFLSLKINDKTVAKLQIATDTGGYSRANVYSTKLSNIIVVEDLQGFYEIDLAKKQISELNSQPCKTPEEYIFIGSFDTDESKEWKFILASERKQLSTERGCIEKIK